MRALVLVAFVFGRCLPAHDVPSDATAHLLVKPAANRKLHLLARVPLRAIRDIDFPVQGPGYLDLDKLAPLLPDAATLWIGNFVELRENGVRLSKPRLAGIRIALPSDRSFASFDAAARHFSDPPLQNPANVLAAQVFLDVDYEYETASEQSAFSIRPGLAHLAARVTTALVFYAPNGAVRAYQFHGDPGLVPLDPRWTEAARRFIALGFGHILGGIDHLLFLACLVIPVRRLVPLVWIVTAFTLAHSITLLASAYGFAPGVLWFPPLIETLIAASIVYMAVENLVGGIASGQRRQRWLYAFGFGLVHGFGFSFALHETLQFAGSHLLTALFAFNFGVELGQLLALGVLVPLLALFFRHLVDERMGIVILSALIAHSGWHWMTERGAQLMRYSFEWPELNLAFLATTMRWAAAVLILGALVRLARARLRPD